MRRYGVVGAAALAVAVVVPAGLASGTAWTAHATTKPKTGWASLPVGAATGFPFGWVKDGGVKISLPPRNTADVDQARVATAPRVGPFRVNVNAGEKAWPAACSLSSAAQLHGLFPAILGYKGKPVGQKGENLGSGSKTPHDIQCTFNLKTSFDPQGYTTPTWVQVSIQGIGPGAASEYTQSLQQQAAQAKKYPAQYANYPSLEHGVKCFYDGNEIQCIKGDLSFWVLGQKVTGGSDSTSDQMVWIDQIEIPLAEKIGSEFTTVS